jgi:hypothetical protein
MPIRWDALLARHVALELHAALAGAWLCAVRLDRAARDLVLLFRDRALLWRLHPRRGWLRLLPPVPPAPEDLPSRARLLAVTALPDERVVRMQLAPVGRGRGLLFLIVELLTNQWNALVAEGDPALVRHVLWQRAGGRAHRVGAPYQPPVPRGRRGVAEDVTLEEWQNALGGLPEDERRAALLGTFAWTSSLNAQAILPTEAEKPGPEGLALAHARWRRLARGEALAEPVVLETGTGLHPYPFPLPGTPHRRAPSLLAAFELAAEAEERAEDIQVAGAAGGAGTGPLHTSSAVLPSVSPSLLAQLETATHRAARRRRRLERELASLEDPAALRLVGDLILARYGEIPSGAASARLLGFDGEPVDVALDPSRPPHANAARYYARAVKAERAHARLPRVLEEALDEERRLSSLLAAARAGDPVEDHLRQALGPRPPTGRGLGARTSLPYRVFRSSGGLEIRVGRGARYNDELTFRHSAPGDVWLHARHAAGAHVVLRWSGEGRPPARDLEEAATLAALHSKARTSATVPVDWTFRKYVRKPRRSPPGRVAAERVETLFVRPDASLLERLAARD